jgi:hypothetical protein
MGFIALNCAYVEPMTGIEPAYSAWEAISSAEHEFAKRLLGGHIG